KQPHSDLGRGGGSVVRKGGLRAAGIAVGVLVALAAFAAPAFAGDQTIKVPCAGPGGGTAGLIAAINSANTAAVANPKTKTTIQLPSRCAFVFTKKDNTVGSGADTGDNALPVVKSLLTITGDNGGDETAIIQRSKVEGTPRFRLLDVAATW